MVKKIAIIAHDGKKKELIEWISKNLEMFKDKEIYATGTTGMLINEKFGIKVNRFLSGPLGGDIQIGNMILEDKIDLLIFFWDPLEAQPHDPDIKALLRIAVLFNIPVACNQSTADYILNSKYYIETYQKVITDDYKRIKRDIDI
ncbi:MAG: methylglyoxal synthase [Spirochaetes bacterium]|nr:methylglyoxal synthase [Spirochaetota bacterium]